MSKQSLSMFASLDLETEMTGEEIDSKVTDLIVDIYIDFKDFTTDMKIGGPEFQALLHTPCREYQA